MIFEHAVIALLVAAVIVLFVMFVLLAGSVKQLEESLKISKQFSQAQADKLRDHEWEMRAALRLLGLVKAPSSREEWVKKSSILSE